MKDNITFKEVTKDNWEAALKLSVGDDQKKFVPSPAESLASAYVKPWDEALDPYLIYLNDLLIGMFYISYTPDSEDNYWIGGFMIDKKYQNKGFGKASLLKILEFIPSIHKNCKQMNLTVEKNNHTAQKLYKSLGFGDTGDINKYDEIIYTLKPKQETAQ